MLTSNDLLEWVEEKTPDHYQRLTEKSAIHPGRGTFVGIMYLTGKLAGEAGEVAELIFKALRDDNIAIEAQSGKFGQDYFAFENFSDERKAKLVKELGDVLWYVARLADEIGVDLSEVMGENLLKLQQRSAKGKLHGDGSDR